MRWLDGELGYRPLRGRQLLIVYESLVLWQLRFVIVHDVTCYDTSSDVVKRRQRAHAFWRPTLVAIPNFPAASQSGCTGFIIVSS
jgi:hypothetical protein